MALDSYANLKTAIASRLREDASTYDDDIDTFIDLAEERHKDEVRIRELIVRNTSFSISGRNTTLPTDFSQVILVELQTTPVAQLEYASPEAMSLYNRSTSGQPGYFTINDTLEVDRPPEQTYTAKLIYYKFPTALSDSNTSNEILARAPGLYLYGALTFASEFFDDDRLQLWNTMYESLKESLHKADRRQRRGQAPAARLTGYVP